MALTRLSGTLVPGHLTQRLTCVLLRLLFLPIALLSAADALPASVSSGTEYYVSPSGSNFARTLPQDRLAHHLPRQ